MSLIIERTPTVPHLNIRFGVLLLVLALGVVGVSQTGVDPRLVSSLTGAVALGGLLYRLISTWHDCPVLVHVLALLLIGLLTVGAAGQLQLGGYGPGGFSEPPPITVATWPGIALRVAAIVVVIFWPRWVERRRSPFRR